MGMGFCLICNLLCENRNFKRKFHKKTLCTPLFANSRFQMGVTVMGFARDFGHSLKKPILVVEIKFSISLQLCRRLCFTFMENFQPLKLHLKDPGRSKLKKVILKNTLHGPFWISSISAISVLEIKIFAITIFSALTSIVNPFLFIPI